MISASCSFRKKRRCAKLIPKHNGRHGRAGAFLRYGVASGGTSRPRTAARGGGR